MKMKNINSFEELIEALHDENQKNVFEERYRVQYDKDNDYYIWLNDDFDVIFTVENIMQLLKIYQKNRDLYYIVEKEYNYTQAKKLLLEGKKLKCDGLYYIFNQNNLIVEFHDEKNKYWPSDSFYNGQLNNKKFTIVD